MVVVGVAAAAVVVAAVVATIVVVVVVVLRWPLRPRVVPINVAHLHHHWHPSAAVAPTVEAPVMSCLWGGTRRERRRWGVPCSLEKMHTATIARPWVFFVDQNASCLALI